MEMWEFNIDVIGIGEDKQSAWANVPDQFIDNPGDCPESDDCDLLNDDV